MKTKRGNFKAWLVLTGLVLSPSVAWAHGPENAFAFFAICVSLPIAIVAGILLTRMAWNLGRKFAANRTERIRFIVSFVAAAVAAIFGFMLWPLFAKVIYSAWYFLWQRS